MTSRRQFFTQTAAALGASVVGICTTGTKPIVVRSERKWVSVREESVPSREIAKITFLDGTRQFSLGYEDSRKRLIAPLEEQGRWFFIRESLHDPFWKGLHWVECTKESWFSTPPAPLLWVSFDQFIA